MSAKIQKWGNSLGLRIPKAVIEAAELKENSEVEIQNKDGAIVIFPIKSQMTLESLLSKITTKNLHTEIDDEPEGNEVW